jgi:glycosyltransferase involved in cell wall biosynthesis
VSELQKTLRSLAAVRVPAGVSADLIVVDNGSVDDTPRVLRECVIPDIRVTHLTESRKGLSFARNRGLAEATGEVILFTDDDVRLPTNWIEGMVAPIADGRAHLVCGGVALAPNLARPWMEPVHKSWLACTDTIPDDITPRAVGANMAFSAEILTRVPGFDTELGAGTPLSAEDGLFSQQLIKAGYTFAFELGVTVEHHFQETRLRRDSFMSFARQVGRGDAYIAYHWRHANMEMVRPKIIRCAAKLALQRIRSVEQVRQTEGMPVWEMMRVVELYRLKQFLIEQRRPRNYDKFGLAKLQQEV